MGKQRIERKNDRNNKQSKDIDNVEFAKENEFIDEINLEDKNYQHNKRDRYK